MIAVFSAVLFLALCIAAAGVISYLADRDVLIEKDAGPLIAPTMFAVATAAVLAQLGALGVRDAAHRGSAFVNALVTGAVTYLFFLVSGSTLYSLGKGDPLRGLLFFAGNALTSFSISVGVIAIVVALAAALLFDSHEHGGQRRVPRWWWEKNDDRARDERD